MKIYDYEKLRKDIATMLQYKWNHLHNWMVKDLIEDIIKVMEQYKNERAPNEKD